MGNFTLTTDTSCDVFKDELKEKNVHYIPLTYTIDGETFEDHLTADSEYKEFYDKIRAGAMPATSQINAFLHEEFFDKILDSGVTEIVHLPLSGGLSATAESAKLGAAASMEKHPKCKIFVVDTLAATVGHRLLLDEAVVLRDSGLSAKLTAQELETSVQKITHWVVVDDLMHLKRGGRVSGASAYIGSLLKIKPILCINNEGKLAVIGKAMGFVKALKLLTEKMELLGDDINNQTVYIACADSFDMAEIFKQMIEEKFSCVVKKGWIGPVIGSHTGVGAVGLVFKAKKRLTNK